MIMHFVRNLDGEMTGASKDAATMLSKYEPKKTFDNLMGPVYT